MSPTSRSQTTTLAAIARHDVRVWSAMPSGMDASAFRTLASSCSVEELKRAARFVFEVDRRAYLAAHGLLRQALSQYNGAREPWQWSFRRGPYGRPELAEAHGSDLSFNLSHSATRVICVVSRNLACGIDVEPLGRAADRTVIPNCLSRRERSWVDATTPYLRGTRFLELWTLKEAISKAVGLGLHLPFAELDLDLDGPPKLVDAPPQANGSWSLSQRHVDGHVEALALRVSADDSISIERAEWRP